MFLKMAGSSQLSGIEKNDGQNFLTLQLFHLIYFLKPLVPGPAYLQASACRQDKWVNNNKHKLKSRGIAFPYIQDVGSVSQLAGSWGSHDFNWENYLKYGRWNQICDIFLSSDQSTMLLRFTGAGFIYPTQSTDGLQDSFQLQHLVTLRVNECAFVKMNVVTTGAALLLAKHLKILLFEIFTSFPLPFTLLTLYIPILAPFQIPVFFFQ